MKALLIALLALVLVGCAAAPQRETTGVRKSTVSKVGGKYVKAARAKKVKAVAKAPMTTASVPVVQPKQADPATAKAKAVIAAMMENPSAAEFYGLQRGEKKLLNRRVDAICGNVRAKDKRGRGGMPFLYIVGHDREDEAYLVNGRSHVSETVHRALCR